MRGHGSGLLTSGDVDAAARDGVRDRRRGDAIRAGRAVCVRERGRQLIARPLLNKDAGFDDEERDRFGLWGLLPARVMSIDEQVALELEHVRRKPDDLEQYIGLAALQDRNETLFYRLLTRNLEEFLPIVYTPTVGRACQQFSHILRRPRGVWITPDDVDRIDAILRGAGSEIRLIVVTDNERILGLGDQGAGGMPIPIGKLALYSAVAGIHPSWTLAVSLDVGTDRAELLDDPLYLGYRAPRLRGARYDDVLEAFVRGVVRTFPGAVLQWEDFKQHNAIRVLERYRDRLPSFNDDVQGTAAVTLAGLLAARRARGGLGEDRFLFLGAGAAAIGIARLLRRELEAAGMDDASIASRIALMDRTGLVHPGRDVIPDDQRPFAVDPARFAGTGGDAALVDPVAVAEAFRPTVLVGTTGCAGAFSEALVREVAAHDEAPIILPLSNPGDRAEATPEQILEWTDGRAIVATGSPRPPIEVEGRRRLVGQANNVFVFPGIGLGAIVAGAPRIDEDTFLVAAHRLAELVRGDRLATGAVYPPVADLRHVAREVAVAMARHLRDASGETVLAGMSDEAIELAVDAAMWEPAYRRYLAG